MALLVMVVAVLALAGAACTRPQSAPTAGAAPRSQEPARGGEVEVVRGWVTAYAGEPTLLCADGPFLDPPRCVEDGLVLRDLAPSDVPNMWPAGDAGHFTLYEVLLKGRFVASAFEVLRVPPVFRVHAEAAITGRPGLVVTAAVPGDRVTLVRGIDTEVAVQVSGPDGTILSIPDPIELVAADGAAVRLAQPACPRGYECEFGPPNLDTAGLHAGRFSAEVPLDGATLSLAVIAEELTAPFPLPTPGTQTLP